LRHSTSPARRYDLLVFDWDGTLMDSISTIVACARHALEACGLPPVDDAFVRGGIGLGLDRTAERLLPEVDEASRTCWIESYRSLWRSHYKNDPVALPGALDTLAALSAGGWTMAVATGKSRAGLERDLDGLAVRSHFVTTRTVDEARSKPHPEMLLSILDELGVGRRRALMIGDTTYDIDMAGSAGVDSVGMLSGSHDEALLRSRGALDVLPSAASLVDWLVNAPPPAAAQARPSAGVVPAS
ncbi:MAG: HAD-IA family hydrolase, partial [Acidobacteriota bacterium]